MKLCAVPSLVGLMKTISKVGKVFFSLEKALGIGISLNQTWINFTQGCFMPCLVKISTVILEMIFNVISVYQYIAIISP